MNVNVDADRRCAARNAEREIGAFWTDAAKRRHHLEVAGQLAIELVDDTLGHLPNVLRLGVGEGSRSNELGDTLHAELAHFLWRRRDFEQPYRGGQRYFVESPDRDNAGS